MEDIKQIQEFFSKPLEENKVTKEDFDKVVKILSKSKYPFTIMLVPKWDEIDIITGQDSPDEIVDDIGQRLDSAGLNWGGNSGITISGDSSNYSRREYSDIFRVNGGHKDYYEESVNEQADHVNPMVAKAYKDYIKAKKDSAADVDFAEDPEKAYRYYSKKLNNTYSTRADRDAIEVILKKKYGSAINESVNEFEVGQKVTYLGHPAVVTATKEYNGRNFVSVSYDKGTGKTKASAILATSGDVKAVNEMDMNDPVLMKMRAAKDKLAKMRAANAGDDGNDKFFDNAKKIAFLKKERAQLMRDMEQEAEPEGGPIADEYGAKLNRIDAAIAKLSGRKEMTYDQAINEELNLPNYGKVTPPKGGASLVGQYNSIQGKSKYDTVIFDYQEGSDKPYGIVQVEGHGIYGSDLLKRLGLRQTKSWTAGVDVYIHDGNYTPVYVSEGDFKALLDFWSGGLDREAKAQSDFYRGRGNTSGTIDEAKVDYDFSERELIRVLRQLKRGASTEIDMIKAFTKALGRDITKDELFSEAIAEELSPKDFPVNFTYGGTTYVFNKIAKDRAVYYNPRMDGDIAVFGSREEMDSFLDDYTSPRGGTQSSQFEAIAEGEGKMPTQDQVDRFFELTQNETHYLNSKPVAGQEATFNLMKIEPWDEYDLSNWNSLVRKAKAKGKAITEDDSYARVSKPRFIKDKNNPNFLNVYIDYDLGPGGNSMAFGKETMSGQIRRLSSAKAKIIAYDVARDLKAKYDLEDIDIQDLENGKVRIFAVSDDFIDMDPNMLSESSKGALNYFNDLKYYYQKAFRYLDVEEREEYKRLVKDFFSKLQVDNKVRAVGLEEAKVEVDDTTQFKLDLKHLLDKHIVKEASKEEENEFHKELDKLVHKTFGHSSDEKKKSMAQELAETIKLGEGVIEEELCPKGKAYIKRRKAAGEKSSAYLSGRAVKVCKGQMSGRKKKK